jgi:glycine cleavage system H lipoate-binding protein
MVVILVVLTIFGFFLAHAISTSLARKREISRVGLEKNKMILSPVAVAPNSGRVPWFPEDAYYHRGHTWVKLEEGNRMKIGLDDFTQQVMGDIEGLEIPPLGGKLDQGEVAWRIRHGKRKLSQLAPLGGTVVELNEKLKKDPTLINRSPYDEGWIMKIQTKGLNKEMPKLMDALQFKVHFDQDKARVMSSFNNNYQTLGAVYGDGEEVIKGAATQLDEVMWKILVTQLFHSPSE